MNTANKVNQFPWQLQLLAMCSQLMKHVSLCVSEDTSGPCTSSGAFSSSPAAEKRCAEP